MPKNRIHTLKDGRYSYNVSSKFGERLSIKSRQGETKAKFRDRCNDLDKEAEGLVTAETFDQLFKKWLQEFVMMNCNPTEPASVKQQYRDYVQPFIGHKKLHKVTRSDVYTILTTAAKKGCAAGTIKRIRGVVSRPYNWAINSLGYEMASPTQGLVFKYPDERKEISFLTDSEIERYFEAAKGSKYYHCLRIMFLAGLRPSEALGIKAQNIKKDHLEIRQGWTLGGISDLKTTKARRDFPMFEELKKHLHQQRLIALSIGSEWLFPAQSGHPSMNALVCAHKQVLASTAVYERGGHNHIKKLKLITPPIECSLYDFRHTFATKQVENGMPLNILAELMGHESPETTMKYYIGLTDKMKKQAVEILEKLG